MRQAVFENTVTESNTCFLACAIEGWDTQEIAFLDMNSDWEYVAKFSNRGSLQSKKEKAILPFADFTSGFERVVVITHIDFDFFALKSSFIASEWHSRNDIVWVGCNTEGICESLGVDGGQDLSCSYKNATGEDLVHNGIFSKARAVKAICEFLYAIHLKTFPENTFPEFLNASWDGTG